MKTKKIFLLSFVLLLLVAIGIFGWKKWVAPTRIALVNFPSFQASNIALSNTDDFITYEAVSVDEMDKLKNYDFILTWAMGLKINEEQRSKFIEISQKVPTHFFVVTSPENKISSLDSLHLKNITDYLDSGDKKNYQNLGRYVRQSIDKKKLFVTTPEAPSVSKKDVLFHIDENVDFPDVSSFEKYLKENNCYKENAPKIAIISGIHSPFGGNREYIDNVIRSFESQGNNVYPIFSFDKRLEFLQEINPDAVVYFPHGRLSMMNGDVFVEYLKQRNIPIFAPISILQLEEDWLKDKMGMFGGFMGQTIVMPELDGAIYPHVIIAQEKNDKGFFAFKTIPNRLDKFTQIVQNFIQLKHIPTSEKKVAIYYFKGIGSHALAGQGLEAGASLYNLLKRMKAEGFKVENLPENVREFEALLDRSGSVIPDKAFGVFDKFIKEGNPALVETSQYKQWMEKSLTKSAYDNVINTYGAPEGGYMSVNQNGKDYLAVAQITFGNVVILPQPAVALGEDDFTMAHGVEEPPTHAYLGSYFWVRNTFKADALLHFGTHGSLEFTPGKQVALCSDDWSDALVGAIPHFYYYTIANIGESMMAKRRSYATTLSYLTPAFEETDMRNTFNRLQDYIRNYLKAPDNQKREASLLVKKVAVDMGLHRDLRLDSIRSVPYSEEDIMKLDNFAEEISTEKINGTLYITGEPYTTDQMLSTVLAMGADPIAYSLAALDKQEGKVSDKELKSQVFFTQKYLNPAKQLIRQILAGKETSSELTASFAKISVEEIEKSKQMLTPMRMPFVMDSSGSSDKKNDEKITSQGKPDKENQSKGDFTGKKSSIPDSVKNKMPSMTNMGGMPQKGKKPVYTKAEKERARAIVEIDKTINNIVKYRKALQESPDLEMQTLFNAMKGGYVAPSSGGDLIANPRSIPTGRNLYSINAEITPTEVAWDRGVALAQNTIDTYFKQHGKYPQKIAYTFWSSEFIETEGVSIAQALYMLGVEPMRDSFGRITDLQLIPSEKLNRPRIDIVVQTSGQFRDLAASRLFLLTRAIELASSASDDEEYENYINKGNQDIEKTLVDKGISPKEARELSKQRIFGGLGGGYSTGTKDLMLSGDKWETQNDIAQVYINNMGAVYGLEKEWGEHRAALFEASLQNTDVLIQPRQSNVWGALSLDHVFEFMGGMNTAIKKVTGKDPDAYLADYRNHNRMRMQELKEAVGVESRATIFNPKYVKDVLKGGKTSAEGITELVTNAFGWEATRPEVIDDAFWNQVHDLYVLDKENLGIRTFFERENPAAMQEITAVMIETVRKGLWKATDSQLKALTDLHLQFVERFGLEPSGFSGNNAKLQEYIEKQVSPQQAATYRQRIAEAKNSSTDTERKDSKVLRKEELSQEKEKVILDGLWIGIGVVAVFVAIVIFVRIRKRSR
ncbi:cobaltochelatase subunit CobN [Capnocytophaga felis]|uniref:Protoporphyrin IX magnesium chelatase n=1 Tax=Capnocytophaga felis TaxID=2267611 RepID=A0A5M4B6Z1_9FLAO|nr:cobaltochelatase subunit CobN [Capnocytophaga felis]GET45371.1 protoporphyrin IX magnesium chelatase [Capnocytophaga felis]GET47466.1 protoporphyrin IX magnesium chelatase [Capnocytophaga felis]